MVDLDLDDVAGRSAAARRNPVVLRDGRPVVTMDCDVADALVAAVRASIEALRELDENPDLAHPDAVWYGGAAWREALAPFGDDRG